MSTIIKEYYDCNNIITKYCLGYYMGLYRSKKSDIAESSITKKRHAEKKRTYSNH